MEIEAQPDETTCGPTCLHAVYRAMGDEVPLDQIIDEIPKLESGGTLGVHLANHALGRGYGATIYTYNLRLFDPTWFTDPGVELADRLERQFSHTTHAKQRLATRAYLEFLRRGGRVKLEDLSKDLIAGLVSADRPVLAGVSGTYLYRAKRWYHGAPDDIRGQPVGHFVVLHGFDAVAETVAVADPFAEETPIGQLHYTVDAQRVVNALLLGIVTYDANLIVLEPPAGGAPG